MRYSTLHYERTPTEVLSGKPSRFRKGGRLKKEPGPPLALADLISGFDPKHVEVAQTALRLYAKRSGLHPEDASTEASLRSELALAAATGTWRVSDRGPDAYVLETATRHWIVASDDGTVISHYEPGSDG
jgi:hypothetical protein